MLKPLNKIVFLFLGFLCFFVFFSGQIVKGQLVGRAPNDIVLLVSPENPEPFGKVTAELNNNLIDLSRATIIWRQNGKEVGRGVGLKKISLTVGRSGIETIIKATVTLQDGSVQSVQKTIQPGTLDLLWEAGTITPPFYKGKALPSPKSVVQLTAMPFFSSNGKTLAPSELYYKWYIGSKFMSDYSGKGKSFFRLSLPKIGGEIEIKVIVSSLGESIKAEKKITLTSFMPEILFYEETPFTGPKLEKALPNSVTLSEKEYSVWAGLYNFSLGSSLTYNWSQNGTSINVFGNSITFAKKGVGFSNIVLSVKSENNILQFGKKELNIQQMQ